MEEQLITFETAKLAKEKGFNIPQNKMYSYGKDMFEYIDKVRFYDGIKYECSETPYNWNDDKSPTSTKYFSAPTQSLLQKWLREKHGIHIVLIPTINAAWTYKTTTVLSERDEEVIIGIKDVGDLPPYKNVCGEDFSTYEKALERGLQEALKLIP